MGWFSTFVFSLGEQWLLDGLLLARICISFSLSFHGRYINHQSIP